MERTEERRYEGLSPFELKNKLVELAKHRGERLMLNAGRGNPNWIALEPRAAFFRLGEFAVGEARRVALAPDFGGLPKKRGIARRLRDFVGAHAGAPGSALLARGVDHACAVHGFDPDLLVGEWVDGILGDHYPLPVRMLPHAEALVRAHLVAELFGGDAARGRCDLFAVEGASAGITYVFQSLVHSRLLAPGDTIALGVPIFTPYLEVPRLPEYRFELVEVVQDEAAGWRYPAAQIDKLADPRVKAFLAVNPSNPTAVAMDAAHRRAHRPDRARAARPHRDHRRRLRVVRRRLHLAGGGGAAEHDRPVLVLEVLGRDRTAPRRGRPARIERARRASRGGVGPGASRRRASATARSRRRPSA